MRILEYRQKLDSYKIRSWKLCLHDIDITIGNDSDDTLDGFQKLAKMADLGPKLAELGIKDTDLESLFSAAEIGEDFRGLRFGAIDIKACCLNFGFYAASDKDPANNHEERNYRWIATPLTATRGKILVATIEDSEEKYEIEWSAGHIARLSESVGTYDREYINISDGRHVSDANLSAFLVTEYASN